MTEAAASARLARLRWQCRRGMRELDVLLQAYLEQRFEAADDTEKQAFEQLLDLSDPELAAYLLRRETPPDASLRTLVEHVRR